ncbi:MAG: class I SAM-dependent rRNA methyltransferase [Gammaproteobacteria bacterium]
MHDHALNEPIPADHPGVLLRLKKGEERRLRGGHPWVFSNEIDTTTTPISGLSPGQAVEIYDYRGGFIGSGYANPRTLILARLLNRHERRIPLDTLIGERLREALILRQRLFSTRFFRLAFAESDGLPGLVVDCYGDVLVAQMSTAGMEALTETVLANLRDLLQPVGILLRNDMPLRKLEGLPQYTRIAFGRVPETVLLTEHGVEFEVPLLIGQKTGWYYDQRDNRARMARYAPGQRVLDVYSYLGGFGLAAAAAGAREVVCVDASALALEYLNKNATRNGLEHCVRAIRGDASAVLRALKEEGERFDMVVLDPPAFIKRKKDLAQGLLAYRRINQLAMQVLAPDGILVTSSCSYHAEREGFAQQVFAGARAQARELQFLELGSQSQDHPVHPAIPETAYLKTLVARVVAR